MMWNADLAWVLIAGGFVLIALMLQRMLLNGLKPQKLVGDESEYLRLANGKRDNTLWVRVPLGAAPLWFFRRWPIARQTTAGRAVISFVSSVTVGLTTWFAFRAGGPAAALTAGTLALLCVERGVLAIHLWSDIGLGLWLLLLSEVMRNASSLPDMAMIGGIVAVGVLTRIDFLAAWGVAILFAVFQDTALWPTICFVAGPTVIAVAGLTLLHGMRHGVWAPDTSLLFNISVAVTEARHPEMTTQDLMHTTVARRRQGQSVFVPSDSKSEVWLGPALYLLLRRLVVLLGPETFVRHNLLNKRLAGYRPFHLSLKHGGTGANLSFWFSAVFLAFLLLSSQITLEISLLVMAVVMTQAAVQTRSRYRMSLLPVLATNVAIAVWSGGISAFSWSGLALGMACVALQVCIRPRSET